MKGIYEGDRFNYRNDFFSILEKLCFSFPYKFIEDVFLLLFCVFSTLVNFAFIKKHLNNFSLCKINVINTCFYCDGIYLINQSRLEANYFAINLGKNFNLNKKGKFIIDNLTYMILKGIYGYGENKKEYCLL